MRRGLFVASYVLILLLALLVRYMPASSTAHLPPFPDALEYSTSALSLYLHGAFVITINHMPYPSHFPFGFPLLLTPALALFGPVAYNALYSVLFLSVATVALTMLTTRKLFGDGAALVAGLVVAMGRQHLVSSQEIMSDGAGALLTLLAAYFVLLALDKPVRERYLFGAGFSAGLSVAVRYSQAVLLASLTVAVILALRRSPRQALRSLVIVGAGAACWMAPLLIYHWRTFGSPLITGYQYWDRLYEGLGEVLDASALLGNARFYLKGLLGGGWAFYHPRFVLVIAIGAAAVLLRGKQGERRRLLVPGILAAANAALFVTIIWLDLRFVLFVALVAAIVGARGLLELGRLCARGMAGSLRAVVPIARRAIPSRAVGLIAGAIVVWVLASIAQDAAATVRSSYLYTTGVRHEAWPARTWRYEVMRYLDDHIPADAMIVSAQSGPFVDYYVLKETARVYMPISHKDVYYADRGPGLQWAVADESLDLLDGAIRQGQPVYLIDDPPTLRQAAALTTLRARFAFVERGKVTIDGAGTLTLYQLQVRSK